MLLLHLCEAKKKNPHKVTEKAVFESDIIGATLKEISSRFGKKFKELKAPGLVTV